MLRCIIISLVAVATCMPAVAEELPRQQLATTASMGSHILTVAHPSTQANDPTALELYRRGLTSARRGDADQAFADFRKALELDPGLALAY
jgi:Flp pilus assembly protein TadD